MSRVDDLKAQISTLENGLGELKITVTDMLDNQMKLMKNGTVIFIQKNFKKG